MALSCYSNWDSSFQQWGSDDMAFDDPELQSLHDAWNADDYSVDLNALFDQNNSGNSSSSSSSLLPYYDFNNYEAPFHNLDSFETLSFNEFEPFNSFYPKSQRLSNSDELLYPSYFDPCLTMLQDHTPPEIPMPLPLPEFSIGSSVKREEASGGGGGVSAQSIAARQRRRRITDKTRELGKLVPGGQKMNTAEMLESARKYIKFMQAQVALLESIAPPPHHQEVAFEGEEEFQKLLESPLIQEKLYSTENCLLPIKFVEQLGCDAHAQLLKSNPHFLSILEKGEK